MWCAQAGSPAPPATTTPPTSATGSRSCSADPRSLVTVASKAQAAVDYLDTHTRHPLPDTAADRRLTSDSVPAGPVVVA